jgi:hypothetical protein
METHQFNIGDKVICINDLFELDEDDHLFNFPKLMEIYTIRGLYDESVYLEEIINPLHPEFDLEICFYNWRFVKLLETEDQQVEKEVLTLTI